jgi:hypothetical protein
MDEEWRQRWLDILALQYKESKDTGFVEMVTVVI